MENAKIQQELKMLSLRVNSAAESALDIYSTEANVLREEQLRGHYVLQM